MDYPLLIPGFIARTWKYIGIQTQLVPIFLAFIFTFATIGILIFSLRKIDSKNKGLIAGLILLGIPFFIRHSVSQTADIPLSFFYLSSLVLLCFQNNFGNGSFNFLILSGLLTGMTMWTKNRRILFFVVSLISILWCNKQNRFKYATYFLIGASPVLFITILFKILYSSHNVLLSGQGNLTINRLLDISRYILIIEIIIREIINFKKWNLFPLIIPVAVILFGIDIEKRKKDIIMVLIILSLTILGYFFVYVTTPLEIEQFVRSTFDWLFLQVIPSILFVLFLSINLDKRKFYFN